MGGTPTKHAEHWKVHEIVESIWKYKALTFRKTFGSNNKRDALKLLKDIIHNMRPAVEGQTQGNPEAAKWYLWWLNLNFCNSTKLGVKADLTVTFWSEVCNSFDTHKLDYQFHVKYNQIVQRISEFQRSGSGWVVDHL